jgi:hypothetical protein
MDYGKHHHASLDYAEALKKMDAVSHGEGCQKVAMRVWPDCRL